MPEWVYVQDIAQYEGQAVELRGWLYNKRSAESCIFFKSAMAPARSSVWCSREPSLLRPLP